MGKLRNILLLSCLTLLPVRAERVGLVMSGGGAKGVAHIGLIQALEDNGIPIDYITGTSIGAVVGGLYAMGYSPAEMMELIKSKEFFNWMNGTVENEYIDFFRMPNPTPEIINASINLRDTTFNTGKILPTSLVNPIQMNFAFLQLTAQYTAQCQGDFNQLFVPFRSVAADVNNRRPYIFRMGDVGDAIRSSMTFPLVFKAIKVDGELLYDGGIYNNYPVDIMQSDFDPEHIIGSVVADLPKRPDDYDMVAQVQNMIMHPSNYQLPEDIGIQIQYDLKEISLLDFHKADSLYRIGYEGAMQQMDSIKQRISRRVDPFTLNLKRYIFKSQTPPLKFRKITINGATEIQRDYILKVLKQDGNSLFDLEDFKVGYFKLLSDKKITEIQPHAIYDPLDETFILILDVELENSISLSLGANLSSTTSNQMYLGASYRILNQFSQQYAVDAYMGKIYNAFKLSSFFYFSGEKPQYFSTELSNLNYNFFQGEKLFYKDDRPAFIKQREYFLKFRYGLPWQGTGKMEIGFSGGILSDSYMQTKLNTITDQSFDNSLYSLINASFRLERNNLNDKQYPTQGKRSFFMTQFLTGIESYQFPDSTGRQGKADAHLSYFQISSGLETYHRYSPSFTMGYRFEALFNNKRSLDNYTSSILQAPAFTPTLHSRSIFNEAYHSNQYASIGFVPIWDLVSNMHVRGDIHGFFPYHMLYRGPNQEALESISFKNAQYIAEVSLVYKLPFASLSLFVNHYSYPKSNWNIGINLGYLLFNRRFIE